MSVLTRQLSDGDTFNFYQYTLRQSLYSHSRTSREIAFEIIGIYSIHFCEQRHICQEDSRLHDMSCSQTGFSQYILDIFEHLSGLFLDASFYHFASSRINGNLAGKEHHSIRFNLSLIHI